MLDPAAASDTLASLIDQARRAGADAADAVYVGDRSTSVGVRMGALEDVSRAEGQEIGLRLFVGRQSAAVATSDLAPGISESLTVELKPGSYEFYCSIPGHKQLGMDQKVTVT